MAMNKKKTTTAIVAGVTAVALLLGGTFAWTSISQRALNEAAGIVNVGGRLHDDFNGENKDIYVENFTDPLNGGQPIYARIKLTEYMEVGQDAGGFGADVNNDGRIVADPVIDGTDINDLDSWKVFIPGSITGNEITCKECTAEGNTDCTIHNHWKWEVGGKTTYMPTFNKDKDSLLADINGTYHGTNDADKVYYDDYVVYTIDTNGAQNVEFTNKETVDGPIYSVSGNAYYDDDTDEDPNDHENMFGVRVETETHTAKETVDGSVILMEDWDGTPGNYWVYDTDGWAYWANPIMPGESTGLLLDGIDMYKNPGEKCYYSINVVAQFATVGDWEYFNGDSENPAFDGTDKALELLEAAAKNVTIVTVTNNGETTLAYGDSTTFTATASKASDAAALAEDEFTWALYDADLNPVTTSTIENGMLTIGVDEMNENLIIAATHTDSGAVGLASVAVITDVQLTVTQADDIQSATFDVYYPFEATYKLNGVVRDDAVITYQIEYVNDKSSGNYIYLYGNELYASGSETPGTTFKIKATATYKNRTDVAYYEHVITYEEFQLEMLETENDVGVSGEPIYLKFTASDGSLVSDLSEKHLIVTDSKLSENIGTVSVSDNEEYNIVYTPGSDYEGGVRIMVNYVGKIFYVDYAILMPGHEPTFLLYHESDYGGYYLSGDALPRDFTYAINLVKDHNFVEGLTAPEPGDRNNPVQKSGAWTIDDGNTSGVHSWYPYITCFAEDFKIKTDYGDCCEGFTLTYAPDGEDSVSTTFKYVTFNPTVKYPEPFSLSSGEPFTVTIEGLDPRSTTIKTVEMKYYYKMRYIIDPSDHIDPKTITADGKGTVTIVFPTDRIKEGFDRGGFDFTLTLEWKYNGREDYYFTVTE